jgi:acetate kinase
VSIDELDDALEHESGLSGLAGSGDVAVVERAGTPEARLALDIYCYRIAQAIAAMATALGGLDALAFTAGVGEHSSPVRADICSRLAFLGVSLDDSANNRADGDAEVGASSSSVRVHVVTAREDVVVARAVRSVA